MGVGQVVGQNPAEDGCVLFDNGCGPLALGRFDLIFGGRCHEEQGSNEENCESMHTVQCYSRRDGCISARVLI
jgi:hypothetical protein